VLLVLDYIVAALQVAVQELVRMVSAFVLLGPLGTHRFLYALRLVENNYNMYLAFISFSQTKSMELYTNI
jgi:hypothetical protein